MNTVHDPIQFASTDPLPLPAADDSTSPIIPAAQRWSLSLRARKTLFLCAAAFCLTPWASPPVALALGAILALTHENPFARLGKALSGRLLQICVVLLGFGMDLPVVLKAGANGAGFAALTIVTTLALGWWLGKVLGILPKTSALISAGTAICGGSAIAAVGSVIGVAEGEITVAMGTVFILNAVALYLFPVLGHAFHLSQAQFGTWAGVAIHDISSVVGAASRYGLISLQTATAVKLSRALWIIPVAFGAAYAFQPGMDRDASSGNEIAPAQKPRISMPWFVGFFLLASVLRSYVPGVAYLAPALSRTATLGLTLTLFLIGAGLSAQTLRKVGWRPLLQGVVLWVFISVASLGIILRLVCVVAHHHLNPRIHGARTGLYLDASRTMARFSSGDHCPPHTASER